jgi:nucleotide-binding universal stress UspA family protein
MKTILVLSGGSASDGAVFGTALGAARPLAAHLDVLHIRIGPGEAAIATPHLDFAGGAALRAALERLDAEADARSAAAAQHFQRFCTQHDIAVADAPSAAQRITARWREERDDAVRRMIRSARHDDLVVVGRASHVDGLPADFIELLLVESGRPVLVASAQVRQSLTGTVMLCWKETATSARAAGAALPLLAKAGRVIVVGVEEGGETTPEGIRELAERLAWHGINAQTRWLPAPGRSVAEELGATAAQCDADLLVMGGYGHSRAREMLFGGCTRHFLDHADRPVLLMH